MWNGLVPHPHVVEKKLKRDISGMKGPSPAPEPPAQGPVPGREITITSGYKNQLGLRLWKTETARIPGSSF